MTSEPVLCRGWTASQIREAMVLATDNQREVLGCIAMHAPVTGTEVAEHLGLTERIVRGRMSAFSRITHRMGVTDPADGKPSWPFTYRRRRSNGHSEYLLTDEVRRAILDVTGA